MKKEDKQKYAIKQNFGQKLLTFWYYNKFILLGVVLSAVVLLICVTQCSNAEQADMTVGVYMNRMLSTHEKTVLEEAVKNFCYDVNGDKMTIVKIYDFSYLETQNDEIKQLNKEKLMSELTDGTCVLYITDDYFREFFEKNDISDETMFGKFITFGEKDGKFSKTLKDGGFENPNDLVFTVRKIEGTVFGKRHKNAEKLRKVPLQILYDIKNGSDL